MSFSFIKPINWKKLPMYKKIQYYSTQLDERFAPYVDKIEAKQIVKNICGDDISVAPIIRILDNPTDFSADDINVNNMVKASHGSGWNININNNTNVNYVQTMLQSWNKPYSNTERQYTYIKPRFFIEQKVNGPAGNADVFMFRCIHGEPISIGVKRGGIQNSYDIHWNPLASIQIANLAKPVHLDKMLILAKLLSSPFEFVRIDFYYVGGIIYFSEFTFTPAAGAQFFPMVLEERFGSMWV
jgi:hypothetical protein